MSKRYKAFISYSREDEKYVKKLHTMLETYIIPKELYEKYPNLPKKLSPIFRDIEQLKSGDKLPKEILKKLIHSENLIVVCSPHSAKSEWVNKEILDFKKIYGEDRIFPIIIDGTPYTDDENECFTDALKYKINDKGELTDKKTDILASNMIKSADGKEFAQIKLISGLLSVENDDLWNFEEKRKNKRLIRIGISVVIFMLFLVGVTSYSIKQKNKAEKARYSGEELIKHTLFDLTEELEPIGKLNLLKSTQDAVAQYYEEMGNDDNNPNVLRNKSVYYTHSGDFYMTIGDLEKAKKAYKNDLKITEQLANLKYKKLEWRDDLSISYERLGDVYKAMGELNNSKRMYEKMLSLREKLNHIKFYRNLYIAYNKMGDFYLDILDLDKAKKFYIKAFIKTQKSVSSKSNNTQYQRDLSVSYDKFGDLFVLTGEISKAIENYERTLEIAEQLLKLDKINNTKWQRDISISYEKLAEVYKHMGYLEKAQVIQNKAFIIRKKLAELEPLNSYWQRDLSVSYEKNADIYHLLGEADKAKKAYKEDLNILLKLHPMRTDNLLWKEDLILTYIKIADFYMDYGQKETAKPYYDTALSLAKVLDKKNIRVKNSLANAYLGIGHYYKIVENFNVAIDYYEKSLYFREELVILESNQLQWQKKLAMNYEKLGDIYMLKETLKKSELFLERH